MKDSVKKLFQVYGEIGFFVRANLVLVWGVAMVVGWGLSSNKALPYPQEVVQAIYEMWAKYRLLSDIGITLKLNVVGLAYAAIISLCISYLSVIPFFEPLNRFVQWLRYIPIIGFNLVFLTLFAIGWSMKVAMLTTGMSFFLVTSMTAVIVEIPRMKYELAKVLGYSDWHVFYTVVVRPTLPQMIDAIAHNAAIGWVMITSIETFNRTEGGLGSQIYAHSATNNLARVYGCLFIIGVIAVVEDWIFGVLKRTFFPYSTLAERG
ncbi:MAG TPA: ABC transporter permease subunit [Acidobacteriota bacterium]|nr:ABC transporter permease subunit [Acidobacteriota bacterium]HNH83996.1 ABC transporter permease subunit [Acidobacteriota bacterium]